MKVLHVTEAFGGGVTSAINTYVAHSPQCAHYLFATIRPEDQTGEESSDLFVESYFSERGVRSLLEIGKFINRIRPDVIHAHSTYAGFFLRLLPGIDRSKIIYTPHAYAFLRNDSLIMLRIYYLIEKLLSRRCAVIAACGKDEENITKGFNGKVRTIELVNVCGALPEIKKKTESGMKTVVMVGRVSKQKDYVFYSEVASYFSGRVRFIWIGGGDEEGVVALKRAGVEVTGWISRGEVLEKLAGANLYFHSSAWDGFPISVLEASNYEIPLLLRDIGPFTAENLNVISSVEEAIGEVDMFVNNSKGALKRLSSNSLAVSEYHTGALLSARLGSLYAI
jgi:glycosyltransferase involved in cell wall biosynthesis